MRINDVKGIIFSTLEAIHKMKNSLLQVLTLWCRPPLKKTLSESEAAVSIHLTLGQHFIYFYSNMYIKSNYSVAGHMGNKTQLS